MPRGARRRAEEKPGHVCRVGPAVAGQRGRGRLEQHSAGRSRKGHREEGREGQPHAESGRDSEAPEFTLEIKLFPNKSLYAVTFDDSQLVKNLCIIREERMFS